MAETDSVKLTAFSRGSGCGCKIAPDLLQSIIRSDFKFPSDKNLLVGNELP
jgi:selenide, water dikinase